MKKFIPILFAAIAFASCEKNPDIDKLDNEYLVITNYDKEAPFSSFHSYYMPDSILLITDKEEKEYWTSESSDNASEILAAFKENMERLYTEAPNKTKADVGLQISYVANTYYFTSWDNNPWWHGYPGYWSYGYWGGWEGWYYPYPITFSYRTGSFITELINLNSDNGSVNKKLKVIWSSHISGLLNHNGSLRLNKTLNGINQAFSQSPYLKK